jgi:hypothetical protein
MNELERNLNKVLEEHQHESGLHMIGGQRRLVDRLRHFIEENLDPSQKAKSDQEREN